jgi:exopolyphosphatase/guanosine-5'-triphosphate,3'-diphosphate pyrophosphatase
MENTRTIAVIDIGSNSIVLLVAKCHRNGHVEPVNELFAITSLGKEISKNGMLSEDAVKKTIEVSKEMKMIAEREGAEDIIAIGTHAVRVAKNRSEFLVNFNKELHLFPEVLSGREEAKFTYLGATCDMPADKECLTIDIGGGSFEVAFGTKNIMIDAYSLPIGCLSLCEKFNIEKRLWLINDRVAAQNYIKKMLLGIVDPVNTWMRGKKPLVIVSGGTSTTYAAILLGKNLFDRAQVHMKQSSRREVAAVNRTLSRLSIEDRVKVPGMEKERAEVLPGGLLILHEILTFFAFDEFKISVNGIRFGIARDYIMKNF